ncbi:TonB-dependent receptor [Niastella koreensis]|uniref:TonB-dependent receptor plug n=2 Tax=Niastella koreensis TaxID=354356 RepID=G8THU8_NIAKG|nr:TonB-dependent receptor [Niastella koreensis]AEV98543.1 TonB-dependent receptor plug [Niastella koreensis GR20-10]OQP53014.1 TonB-dependent receptor [Niastella koreensis]
MTKLVAIVFGLCSVLFATAQEKFTLSGYVRDSLSGETLIGATVSVNGHGKSIVSNQFGFYSITLPRGAYPVLVTFAGYQPVEQQVTLDKNVEQSFYLSLKPVLEEVIVSARKRDGNVTNAQMGKIDLSITQVKSVPVLLGETDLLKTLQLLPGVRNAGEGNTGLYVRGGGPDQNLILLDDAIVYNTGHLFGFFSIFNSDAIKNISLIKGGMPAQYGGRLSSVLDVAMKEGNLNKFEVEGGIGAIASRLSVQGPIKKNKSSFIISGRRTYIDLLVKPFIKSNSDFYGSGYYFYDFNAKVNYIFSEKDRLYLSGYFGRDVFTYRNSRRVFKADIPWGNSTATLRWNHVFNRKLFANTTLVYNDYAFSFGATQNDFSIKLSSGIHDWNAKTDFDYYPSTQHKVRFGAAYTYHTFTPNVLSGNQGSNQFTPDNAMRKYAGESGIYLQDEWDVSDRIKINAGLRFSRFVQMGPYKIFSTDINGNKSDSITYGRNKPVKAYGGFEPRFTLRYAINDETSLKAGITRNLQYIHLVSNAGSTLPTDLWVPSTYRVKPQESWQYAAGYFKNFSHNMWETSLEVYYKQMNNQIEYREGYTPTLKDPENDFVFGKGWSYGTELFLNKTKGRLTGWIGYTLSWTWRKFDTLNEGQKYPSKYDRRHDLSVVATYQLNNKWKLSGVFVYGSGNATSLPERFYVVGGILTQEYSRINQYRLAPYHRMDLSAVYTPRTRPDAKFQTNWVFSIYNVYSRLNPYFIYFSQEGSPYDGSLTIKAEQVSLFPIIPSITWNFKF